METKQQKENFGLNGFLSDTDVWEFLFVSIRILLSGKAGTAELCLRGDRVFTADIFNKGVYKVKIIDSLTIKTVI